MSLRISLRELEVFVAVAELGTVTRAAERVALTQSAASQALDKLEQGLDAKLFDRVGRRLLINEHGRLLLPRARALLDAAADVQDLFQGGELALRIGASTTIANYLLPPLLAAFRKEWPQARLELEVANTRDIVEAVAAFRVDFGLIEGPCHHPELLAHGWRQDELIVFAAADHPLAGRKVGLDELADAPWILREAGSGTREEVERVLLPHLNRLAIGMELGHSEAIKHAVAAGLGVSCLSRHVAADLLAAGTIVEVDADLPRLTRTLYRIQHRDKAIGRGMAAFSEKLQLGWG
ncbi:LysR family transcriptional regulator [Chromobacterium violaceum]|uniref:CysJI operon transcriptional activator n=2 Tax=Chromobacterium violaceum TaxID=536 RepID=A0AAX2MG70_CHRVL|nr:LysR family transcriptional regulator [Chromobacterium violaceum]AAQ58440.1 probable transcriptional regulator, LysR family [Chromobacterium violaceum ATCC 12472]MBA8734112.1 LysR family transcriptional regulator [Chromobacterium violaceum]STB69362.1 CysJI operon transcriptional activator [Chromobacterium violaceum]SUX39979.1 CysJI operon transcriptional activator [Chromobacterium violaceum]SUY93375.1 CysJI operon transcriptional activator [Chromobacterium violaceum]